MEDIINAEQYTVHVKGIVPYPVTQQGAQASIELVGQAAHFDKKYHLLDETISVQRRQWTYEVRNRFAGYDKAKEDIWEPIGLIREDKTGVSEDYLHTADEQYLN